LETFGELGSAATEPTLIVGDFNASYWHPAFRDLLRSGLSDAHTVHGKGFSASWPTGKFFPAFVRLDHALTGNGLVSTSVQDFTVPGSDHRGFVVSVVPAR
jgi:endonuclease/exonuclease/phosphatase (EEP) superfamily protein YafD